MKNRSRKCLTVIIGAAMIAAPIVSAAQNTSGNVSNYELLQQIRNLQQEVADLRDRIDRQEYSNRQSNTQQTTSTRVLPSHSQAGSQTNFPSYPSASNQQQQSQVYSRRGNDRRFEEQRYDSPQAPQTPVETNTIQSQSTAPQPVNRRDSGPVVDEIDLSGAAPVGGVKTESNQAESAAVAPYPERPSPVVDNSLRVEDRVTSPQQNVPVNQARPSSSVANPQADLLRNGDKAIQTSLLEEDLYAKGLNQLKLQQYKQAVSLFNSQLQSYPRGQRSADAYYWIGESLYILENLESSKKSYQSILTLFPSSKRVPNALFKLAKIENEQGDKVLAKATLQSLLARYPNSSAAAQAKASLSDLL